MNFVTNSRCLVVIQGHKSPKKNESNSKQDPDYSPADDNNDDDEEIVVKRRRSRIVPLSSDSDESDRENESDNGGKNLKRKSEKLSRQPSLDSPISKKKSKRETDESKLSFEDKLAVSIADSGATKSSIKIKDKQKEPELDDVNTVWLHNKLDFLQPANIRDAEKNKPSQANYDPTTLFVPEAYLNKLTPVRKKYFGGNLFIYSEPIHLQNYS